MSFFARGDVRVVQLRNFSGGSERESPEAARGRAASWRALFRTRHGTDFDAGSALDRGKMIALRHEVRLR